MKYGESNAAQRGSNGDALLHLVDEPEALTLPARACYHRAR
jgi:hypothetical protein